jgi:dienelactone hydrolase
MADGAAVKHIAFLIASLCAATIMATGSANAQPSPLRLDVTPAFDPAGPAPFRVIGARDGETLTIVARCVLEVWRPDAQGAWKPRMISFFSWADLTADASGTIDPSSTQPRDGSYSVADPMAFMWSGYAEDDPRFDRLLPAIRRWTDAAQNGRVGVRVFRGQDAIATADFPDRATTTRLVFETVQQPGLVGVYAAPRGASRLPTLIVLHGSEGNDIDKARGNAEKFAQQGFAVLAIAYYTQTYQPAAHVPTSGIEIDVNQIERARAWIATRTGADAARIGIWGQSKGGEFAMVAASRFAWLKAAVGCVPSDIVWQGFGDGETVPPPRSTWRLDGKPLPFVPLFPYADGRYRDNTDRYERSRRYHPAEAQAAKIPIERTRAKLLLIGGDRDEVWASGAMARAIAASMGAADKGDRAETLVFEKAGHGICGDGSFPVRAYGKDDADPDRKSLEAEGQASVIAFRRTLAFFRETLRR